MKYIILLSTFICFNVSAAEVFKIEYQKGTGKFEQFELHTKAGKKYELKKITKKATKSAELSFDAGTRLSELMTKLVFTETKGPKCTEYLAYSMEGEKGKVCQEDVKRTGEAMKLMYHLNSFF